MNEQTTAEADRPKAPRGAPAEGRPSAAPAGEAQEAPPPSSPPPRGPSNVTVIGCAAVLVLAALATAGGFLLGRQAGQEAAPRTASGQAGDGWYSCGMHPWVILPAPGLCPICHMDLTPLDPGKFTGEIAVDPVMTQSIGVRIEPVVSGPLVRTIRTVGTVDYDETRVRDINIKVPGWIEKLHVDFLGAEVRRGEPLFDLYSPDLYAAQEEYLLALRNSGLGAGVDAAAAAAARDLLESARTRLEFYDITPEQIRALEESGKPAKTMTIYSPHPGVVIDKHANEGMHVDPGMQVYRIADLSKVWVMVTLYEYQLPYVQVGQRAVMTLPYVPGQTFEGNVLYVYPYLDRMTRQVNVRLAFDNPVGLLKPGMYARVELKSTLARERTLASRSAVIDTGERQVAFVSLGGGRFEPREVRMGTETEGGMIEILDGLRPGEMVVTSGQFLLDSEARMREGLAKMIRGQLAAEQEVAVAVEGRSEAAALPAEAQSALGELLEAYFAIGDRLAGDSAADLAAPARSVASGIDRLLKVELPEDPHFWHRHDEAARVRGDALALARAADLEAARLSFADLSVALAKLLRATGVPPSYPRQVHELHCPMYREGQGGSIWLQPAGEVRNPFFGSLMLRCFDERRALPVTGAAASAPAPAGPSETPAARETGVLLDASAREHLDKLYAAYLDFQEAITRESLESVATPLALLLQASTILSYHQDPALSALAGRIAEAAGGSPADLEQARRILEAISDALLELGTIAPPSGSVAPTLFHVYCPMVRKSWLQATREVANPYAPWMLRCGQVKATLAARGAE